MNTRKRGDAHTLALLEAVDEESDLSQRRLAKRLGVALGLANSYLKRCVRKGWVKVRQAPGNRYMYYLTPKGFSEKTRLTARYLSLSMDFYRKASQSCLNVFEICRDRDWRRVALVGISDLSEIALMRSEEKGVIIAGFIDVQRPPKSTYLSRDVFSRPLEIPNCDAWVVTDLDDPIATRKQLCRDVAEERVLVPDILERRPR